jgi:hypothetical protein
MIKALKREKIKNVNFKITESDWQIVIKLAEKYANGNASEWIRHAIVSPASVDSKPKKVG